MKSFNLGSNLKIPAFCGIAVLIFLLLLPFLGEPGWADPKTAGGLGLWVHFLGSLHPVFLHLPIGALVLVLTLESCALLSRGRYRAQSLIPLIFALGASLLALVFGYCLYLSGSYTGDLIERHKDEGFIFCGLLLLCLLFKIVQLQCPERRKPLQAGYGLSLLAAVILMSLAGHHGGLITHGDPLEKLPANIQAKRAAAAEALRGDPVIYAQVIQPILEESCVYCHGPEKQEGDYRMDSYQALLADGEEDTGLVPGDLEKSGIIARLHLAHNDEDHMPPSDKPQPSPEEIALLSWWVEQGAPPFKQKSELEGSPEIDEALASLVSPAERKEREKKRKSEEQDGRKRLLAEKERMKPELDAFNKSYPGALSYISSQRADLRFNEISYIKSFGDAEFEHLMPFVDFLSSASFTFSDVDDQAAEPISMLRALRDLNLAHTGITDAFIEKISSLSKLELLNLYGTKVTSASVPHLLKLPALKSLYIGGTGFSAEQTAALRQSLSENRETPVEVIGADQLPDLALLTEEGVFTYTIAKDEKKYGTLISPHATVTLSSNDKRYLPAGGLVGFTAAVNPGLDFAFHSQNEKKPWVQLSFEHRYRINAFLLKNRPSLPQRADGLELQRLGPDGRWESIWTSPGPLKTWVVDLSKLPEEKREATAFRFINNTEVESMLHLSHLSLWGQQLEREATPPVELGDTLDAAGQGEWAYVVAPHWGHVPGQKHIGSTHGGIVVDRAGRVYVSTDGPNGILVYQRDGTFLTRIAKGAGRYHGLCMSTEDGQEFIVAADNTHIAKYTLSGKLVLKIEGAQQAGGQTWEKATAVAVAPNGDLFVADGHGSSVIFKYNAQGAFIKKFGARGNANGQFMTSHGLTVDARNPDRPLIIVCDRENKRLQHFDMDGNFVKIAIEGLRRPCSVAIWKDLLLVAELAGRAVILDRDYKIVSTLGDNPRVEEHANFHVHPDDWQEGVFTAPHGCSFDDQGNIYIQDWNKWGRVTKLLLTRLLNAEDISRLESLKARGAVLHAVERRENGWKPNELAGLFLWLDADDLSTITASSGQVSQWDDKSGKGYHAYALDSKQRPKMGSIRMHGKNALDFYESRLANQQPAKGNWQEVYVVADWNGGPKFDNFNGLLTGFAGSLGIIGDSNGPGTGLYIPETWWARLRINGQASDGSAVMGTLAKPFMAAITADKATDVTGFSIGTDRGFVGQGHHRDWEGAVCEIIAYEKTLSEAERHQVEGYLAHKWGLADQLSGDHPYKTKTP